MEGPFVGRVAELAALGRQLDQAAAGHGHVVLVTGPAGMGKSTLIRHWLSSLPDLAGTLVASGDQEESTLSGGLLEQLARSASGPPADELAAVLASGRADPLSAGSALLGLLRQRPSPGPVVVVVDDAQWGDELSLKALSFAARRLADVPALCLVVCRPDELTALPPGLLRAIADRGLRLDLAGLNAAEVAELAGPARLTGRAAQLLCEHTSGLPLHVVELLHDLPPDVLGSPGAVLPAPRSLATLVLSRLAGCAPETERLVVAAAVLGPHCYLADAARLAGLADPLPALQQAAGERLLAEEESIGRRCAFPHALIRAAVYRDIGVSRRAELHRRAAVLTGGPAALAHRAAACSGSDPQLAADLEAQAAAERQAGQLVEAAEHLLAAVRADQSGPARDRRLLTAVELLLAAGDGARARACAAGVSELAPSPGRTVVLARLAMLGGEYLAAEELMTQAKESLAGSQAPAPEHVREGAALAACEFALMLIGQHRTADAAAWARRAADTAVTAFTRACSCAVRGGSLAAIGQGDQARLLLESELRDCPDDSGRTLLRACLGAILLRADELVAATDQLDQAVAAGGAAKLPMAHLLEARLQLVLTCYRSGAWDRADAEAERLVSLIDDLDQVWLAGRAHLAAVYVAAARGETERACRHASAAASQLAGRGGRAAAELADAQVAIAVAAGDQDAVVAAARPVTGAFGVLEQLEPSWMLFWPAYAQALARAGHLDEADEVLTRFERLAASRQRRSALAAAGRARGYLEAQAQRPEAAVRALSASVRQLDGLGMPFELALSRLEYGRLLRRAGQRRAAARELGAARALFAGLGAQPFVSRCDDELGSVPAAAQVGGQLPLTSRQLAVARAVASGKSNRQIAADLFISVKTVEFHLGQILARLGADSRGQIGAALGLEGAAGPAG